MPGHPDFFSTPLDTKDAPDTRTLSSKLGSELKRWFLTRGDLQERFCKHFPANALNV